MRTLSDLRQEAENYFRQAERDLDATQNAYRHILDTVDMALADGNYALLHELIHYIEKDEGHLAFQYIGKTHRYLRILNIIALESTYQKTPFCSGCDNAEALWEKYMLTLFAFRRLLFQLSEESVNQAVAYLQSQPVSHFAAYMIVQDELLIPDQAFYETLSIIYMQEWSQTDQQQFLTLTSPA